MESELGSNILSVDLYLSIEKEREDRNEELNRDLPSPEAASLISESEHIFNKALFDGVNEVLDELRPYGRRGQPMPWSLRGEQKPEGRLGNGRLREIVRDVKNRLRKWSDIKGGTLPRSEFYVNGVFDEELFGEFREKKLATLLQADVRARL